MIYKNELGVRNLLTNTNIFKSGEKVAAQTTGNVYYGPIGKDEEGVWIGTEHYGKLYIKDGFGQQKDMPFAVFNDFKNQTFNHILKSLSALDSCFYDSVFLSSTTFTTIKNSLG
jgi:hypothetical protein